METIQRAQSQEFLQNIKEMSECMLAGTQTARQTDRFVELAIARKRLPNSSQISSQEITN